MFAKLLYWFCVQFVWQNISKIIHNFCTSFAIICKAIRLQMQFMKMQKNCIFDTKWLRSYTNEYQLIIKPTFWDISLQKNCISTIKNCFCKDICHSVAQEISEVSLPSSRTRSLILKAPKLCQLACLSEWSKKA